jgi:hypothetical protein
VVIALTVTPGQAFPNGAIRIHFADVRASEGARSRTYLNQKGLASETASVMINNLSRGADVLDVARVWAIAALALDNDARSRSARIDFLDVIINGTLMAIVWTNVGV